MRNTFSNREAGWYDSFSLYLLPDVCMLYWGNFRSIDLEDVTSLKGMYDDVFDSSVLTKRDCVANMRYLIWSSYADKS